MVEKLCVYISASVGLTVICLTSSFYTAPQGVVCSIWSRVAQTHSYTAHARSTRSSEMLRPLCKTLLDAMNLSLDDLCFAVSDPGTADAEISLAWLTALSSATAEETRPSVQGIIAQMGCLQSGSTPSQRTRAPWSI